MPRGGKRSGPAYGPRAPGNLKRRARKLLFMLKYTSRPERLVHFNALWVVQDGACVICRRGLDERTAVIDHDRATGYVRGLLCRPCNLGLGAFRDDPETLRRAVAYLVLAASRVPREIAPRWRELTQGREL